jgi:hypothetical protein
MEAVGKSDETLALLGGGRFSVTDAAVGEDAPLVKSGNNLGTATAQPRS